MSTSAIYLCASGFVPLLLIATILLRSDHLLGGLPKPYNARACQGKNWRGAFPYASKQDIREFLSIFVEGFAFSQKERLKLNPEDQILQIYRALYPCRGCADALEVETLAKYIKERYGFSLGDVWHEKITLGELFQITQGVHSL